MLAALSFRPISDFLDSMAHASRLHYAAVAVGGAFAVIFFKPFFRDFSGFWECIRYCLRCEFCSVLKGELVDKQWSELKLLVWLALSAGCGFLSYYQLPEWFPGMFPK